MLKMSEQQRFETIRRLVRDWVDNNRAAFARQGGEVEEHEGADWDGAAFYTATCLLPHCVARVVVNHACVSSVSVCGHGGVERGNGRLFVELARRRWLGNR